MRPRASQLPAPIRPLVTRPIDAVRKGLAWTRPLALYGRSALTDSKSSFVLAGTRYRYLWHPYMTTWRSERAVELPIAWNRVRRSDPASTLEIGNVLSNYFPVRHLVVDKYERAPGVLNEDAVDFSGPHKFDLIVSVSTLEHVGWDEEPRDPPKVLRAIENLRNQLTDDGELLMTIPRGWNTALDRFIAEGLIPFTERHCLRRISPDSWEQVDCVELEGVKYGHPFRYANGVTVGIVRKP